MANETGNGNPNMRPDESFEQIENPTSNEEVYRGSLAAIQMCIRDRKGGGYPPAARSRGGGRTCTARGPAGHRQDDAGKVFGALDRRLLRQGTVYP